MSAMRFGVLLCMLFAVDVWAEPTKNYVLTGRVLDAVTGQPIAFARVTDDSGALAYSDSLGNYRLPLTKYSMYERAEADGMYPAWVRTPSSSLYLSRDFLMFSLSSPTIKGQITDLQSGKPQPRTQVNTARHFALTDSLGRYVLPLPAPGVHKVSAWQDLWPGEGWKFSGFASVSVPIDSHVVVDLSLRKYVTSSPPEGSLWFPRQPPPLRIRRSKSCWHPGW
jgi:hypothetical protein